MSWTVSGRGGVVFSLGDELVFNDVPLEEEHDGWDWRAPESLRCWLEAPVFETFEGGRWRQVRAEKTYLRSGLGMFSRCLSGHVRASGVCLPTSRVTEVGRWNVVVDSVVPVGKVMDGGSNVTLTRQLGATASFDVSVDMSGALYTWLPHGNCVVVGTGVTGLDTSTIVYDENGVSYDPCCN